MDEFKYGELMGHMYRWSERCGCVYKYRQGNVPGIRKFRGGGGWYRYPKTFFEKLNAYIADEDDGQFLTDHQIAQIEKYRDLPSSWDDMPRSRQGDSWKHYRKTQYKQL